jgi:hypothetical protein
MEQVTTTSAVNLFATKVKETKKTTDKKTVKIEKLSSKVKRFLELKADIDNSTAEMKMLEGDIKEAGRETFLKEYKAEKMKPDNFNIQDDTGAKCMFICMDKYTLVDETKAEMLQAFPGLLDEKLTFTLDPELVNKYGEVISRLIGNCSEIEAEDKPNLICGEKQYLVKKGSIERLMQYKEMETVFELINPICSLKK